MTRRRLLDAQRLLFLCGLLLLAARAHAASPTEDELQEVQNQLSRARALLDYPDLLLEEVHSRVLSSGLEKAEVALQRYLELSKRGKKRTKLMAPLAVAGTALVADDVTGVGAADDFLLPVVWLGLLGEFDPNTGKQLKAPVPGRAIKP